MLLYVLYTVYTECTANSIIIIVIGFRYKYILSVGSLSKKVLDTKGQH